MPSNAHLQFVQLPHSGRVPSLVTVEAHICSVVTDHKLRAIICLRRCLNPIILTANAMATITS